MQTATASPMPPVSVYTPADQVPPPPKIPRLPNLTKTERAAESAFADAFEKDPDPGPRSFAPTNAAAAGKPLFRYLIETDEGLRLMGNFRQFFKDVYTLDFTPATSLANAVFCGRFGQNHSLFLPSGGNVTLNLTGVPATNTYDVVQIDVAAGTVTTNTRSMTPQSYDASTIRAVQQALNARGYNAGPADGQYGASTKDAVIRFQPVVGLPVTGELGRPTLDAIGVS